MIGPFSKKHNSHKKNKRTRGAKGRKGRTKYQKRAFSNQYSHDLFKVEMKVKINPYEGEVDVNKFNHWLQHIEVCFSVNNVREEKNIFFSNSNYMVFLILGGKFTLRALGWEENN
jgi:hypothetical protein